jgi:hypothetical protein
MGDRFKLFGDIDRRHLKHDERISSDIPAWAMRNQTEEMKESIDSKKRMLDMGLIAGSEAGNYKEILKREEDRYNKIMSSRPNIEGKDRDDLAAAHKELGTKIKESMFSRDDMESGKADAHAEARRMKGPTIRLKSDAEVNLAESCGVQVDGNGMVCRDDANRMFRVAGSYLETKSNPEDLRKQS